MKRIFLVLALLGWVRAMSPAQDLAITNARIFDGTGRVLERGHVLIQAGRIVGVSTKPHEAPGTVVLDVGGRTVLPGLIDTHRHDLLGSLEGFSALEGSTEVATAIDRETPPRLKQLLEEGFTTVMMPGMYLFAGLEVRKRLEDGRIQGPRLLFSGPGFCAPGDFPTKGMVCGDNTYCSENVAYQVTDPEAARKHVRALAEAGVDGIKVFVDDIGHPLSDEVQAAIHAEAKSRGLPRMLHAHRVADMVAGVGLGANRLVHTPGDARILDLADLEVLRESSARIATTVSFTSPQFAAAYGFESDRERHQRILQNIRDLVDAGIPVAFGTDSPDRIRPMVEVLELSRVLSPHEILTTMTRDAARFLDLEDELGTIEPGKIADLVVLDGDPLTDVADLQKVRFVIQSGRIVVHLPK